MLAGRHIHNCGTKGLWAILHQRWKQSFREHIKEKVFILTEDKGKCHQKKKKITSSIALEDKILTDENLWKAY